MSDAVLAEQAQEKNHQNAFLRAVHGGSVHVCMHTAPHGISSASTKTRLRLPPSSPFHVHLVEAHLDHTLAQHGAEQLKTARFYHKEVGRNTEYM